MYFDGTIFRFRFCYRQVSVLGRFRLWEVLLFYTKLAAHGLFIMRPHDIGSDGILVVPKMLISETPTQRAHTHVYL